MEKFVIGDGAHGRLISLLTGAKCIGVDFDPPDGAELFMGIGLDVSLRERLYYKYKNYHDWLNVDIVGWPRQRKPGVQILNGAIIMPGVSICENVLINTGAQIDHNCVIGAHSVISPGAILCGDVTLGECCSVGAGAIILQGVKLNAWTKINAGSLVVGPDDIRRPQRMVPNERA